MNIGQKVRIEPLAARSILLVARREIVERLRSRVFPAATILLMVLVAVPSSSRHS